MQCETQEECGEDEDGETVTFPTNSSTTGETPVVPEQVEPDAKQGVNVKCKTRVRHHTLRLGLTAACYAKLGRLQAPFLLTADALDRWKESEKHTRVFKCGKVHRPGRGGHGGRAARVEHGPDDFPLSWHTPANNVSLSESDFVHGFELEQQAADWLSQYLACKHKFQNMDKENHVVVNHWMMGAQLDSSGKGLHFQLMTKIRRAWTSADAMKWTDQIELDFKRYFLGVDPNVLGGTLSKCTQVHEKNGEQHAGYACHSHENPWPVRQKGLFSSKSPNEYFQMFLLWQDHVHRKIHISHVERDCENLRSGGGEFVETDEMELAARDIQDLIADDVVTIGPNGLNVTYASLCSLLYAHRKRAGVSFPKMPRGKKDIIICMVASR